LKIDWGYVIQTVLAADIINGGQAQVSICKFKGNDQSICCRFGPVLGIDGVGVWGTIFTKTRLIPILLIFFYFLSDK
jgi:hypothetical protein